MSKSSKVLLAEIAGIAKKGVALRKSAHNTLVSVIDHFHEHGDLTLIKPLRDAIALGLGSAMEVSAVDWMRKFVPALLWDDESKTFSNVKGVKREIADVKDLKVRDGTPNPRPFTGNGKDCFFFWMERPTTYKEFNIIEAINTLLGRAENAYKQNVEAGKHNIVTRAQIDALKGIVPTLETVKDTGEKIGKPVKASKEATTSEKSARKARGPNKPKVVEPTGDIAAKVPAKVDQKEEIAA